MTRSTGHRQGGRIDHFCTVLGSPPMRLDLVRMRTDFLRMSPGRGGCGSTCSAADRISAACHRGRSAPSRTSSACGETPLACLRP